MRFRAGIVIGLVTGIYIGARLGLERVQQLTGFVQTVQRSEAVGLVADKTGSVMGVGVGKVKDLVEARIMGSGSAFGEAA